MLDDGDLVLDNEDDLELGLTSDDLELNLTSDDFGNLELGLTSNKLDDL